jgi:hypothetical protein
VTFAELFDRMSSAGVSVGIDLDAGEGLVITLDAASSGRSIRYPVAGHVDRAAREIILSGGLRELLGAADGSHVRGSWPEFLGLWPPVDCGT